MTTKLQTSSWLL